MFDTSTLVSAALRFESIPYRALAEAFVSWDLCASPESLAELERVLSRTKFDRYLPRPQRQQFIGLIRRNGHLFAPTQEDRDAVRPACRDPLDNKFLALALAAEADLIVSSDGDLLALHPWNGIPVITAREFLERSQTHKPQ